MRYFFFGLIAGILLSILPFWSYSGAMEIYPEWHGNIEFIKNTEESPSRSIADKQVIVKTRESVFFLSAGGRFLRELNPEDHLISISGSGKYYVRYDKAGTYIEMFNDMGERFWRVKSMEYPYVTSNAKIVLLMNGDHTRIRIIDINGNPAGAGEISGGLCTVIYVHGESDYSAAGFLDGNYYLLNGKGELICSGITPGNTLIKGIAISDNGEFSVIHYGNNKGDYLKLIDISRNESYILPLKNISLSKSSLFVTDEGRIAAIDCDRIILTDKDEIETVISIPAKTHGSASIDYSNGIYSISYTGKDSKANLLLFLGDGTILAHKVFAGEGFFESYIQGNLLFVRGNFNIYCYSLNFPDRD